ncbi:MAG: methyltransferase [Prevotella sp.]|nr:methyltransferase [Prevotella sp.]
MSGFSFKQFEVCHDRCGMKVGTDGCLLGAWASGGSRILDVGTGSGLIALMMAQRFPGSRVTAIDIDADAVSQAKENVINSPFADRVDVIEADFNNFFIEANTEKPLYDAIVSNPPFFENALKTPDAQRNIARHSDSLTYASLMRNAYRLLSAEGTLTVVVPADYESVVMSEAAIAGFFLSQRTAIRTKENKPIKRLLLAFTKSSPYEIENIECALLSSDGMRSVWYQSLMSDFYLR